MPIREGLARLEGVESISSRPNVKEGTCELRMKQGRLLDPEVLSQFIYDIRVGARLRGVEATANGTLDRQGEELVLRLSGSNDVLQLTPLKRKVQQNAVKKKPLAATRSESGAFRKLRAKGKGKALSVRITGPLTKCAGDRLKLEVRQFELTR